MLDDIPYNIKTNHILNYNTMWFADQLALSEQRQRIAEIQDIAYKLKEKYKINYTDLHNRYGDELTNDGCHHYIHTGTETEYIYSYVFHDPPEWFTKQDYENDTAEHNYDAENEETFQLLKQEQEAFMKSLFQKTRS